MAKSTPRRGLQNMRTQSSRKAIASLRSPELYLRLTSLEMERSRRVVERDRLCERITVLDERIQEIGIEQEEMRCRIAERDAESESDLRQPALLKPTISYGFTY